MNQCVEEGQSCAVYLGHYCNWEWITSLPLWVTPKAQCGQIYHPIENKDFDQLFLRLRQRLGAVCIPMQDTLRKILEFRQGTERIARKVNHAVFYMDVRCVRRGYYEAEFKLITREPQKMKEFEVTDIYYQHLEQSILRAPEFWLWSHNRWSRTRKEFNERFKVVDGKVVAK